MRDRGMEGDGEKKRRKKVVRGRERGKREKKRSLVRIPSPLPCPPHPEEGKTSAGLAAATGGQSPATQRCPGHPSTETATTPSPRTLLAGIPNPALSPQGFQSSAQPQHPGPSEGSASSPEGSWWGHHHLPTPPRCSGCSRLHSQSSWVSQACTAAQPSD